MVYYKTLSKEIKTSLLTLFVSFETNSTVDYIIENFEIFNYCDENQASTISRKFMGRLNNYSNVERQSKFNIFTNQLTKLELNEISLNIWDCIVEEIGTLQFKTNVREFLLFLFNNCVEIEDSGRYEMLLKTFISSINFVNF